MDRSSTVGHPGRGQPKHGYAEQSRAFLEPEREPVGVEIRMLDDERARASRLIEREGWRRDEGLHIIFSRGLVALERRHDADPEVDGRRLLDMGTPEERERFLLDRLNALESRYSVMKFTAYNAIRDNETLKMNVTGLTIEYTALSTQNAYLRLREDELRAEIAELGSRARPVEEVARQPRWRIIRRLFLELLR